MSAYQDLCDLLARARERARQRRERLAPVFERAGASIVTHLGVPDDAHEWCLLELASEEPPGRTALADAMSSDEEGSWRIGLRIVVRSPGEPEGTLPLVLELCAREEEEGRVVLSFSDEDPRHHVHPDRPADFAAVAIDAERRLRAWMDENLERVLGAAGPGERYGQYL